MLSVDNKTVPFHRDGDKSVFAYSLMAIGE